MSESDYALPSANILPHSVEAEQALLGAVFHNSGDLDIQFDRLEPRHFYRDDHRHIFTAIQNLIERNQPIDEITVGEELKTKNFPGANINLYIGELINNTAELSNVSSYADIIIERATVRMLIEAANSIAASARNPRSHDSQQLLDQAEERIFAIANGQSAKDMPRHLDELVPEVFDRISDLYENKRATTGLATPFPGLDKFTNGLQPADLVVIAGRPSMGKTSLALNIAENALMDEPKKGPILFFSLEMPATSLVTRMIASLSKVNLQRLWNGTLEAEDWQKVEGVVASLEGRPLFIDDASILTASGISTRARRIARQWGPLRLILVDYLQLMHTRTALENRTNEISAISRQLKALAKEMNCPVIALSQLNRELEHRQNKRPQLSDLRDSGAIEQDADLILFIYRDEVYNPTIENKGIAEIIISKQRNGPTGSCELFFAKEFTRFESIERTEYDPQGLY